MKGSALLALSVSALVLSSLLTTGSAHPDRAPVSISLGQIGRYSTGVFGAGAAEIVAHDPRTQRLFVVNGASSTVDVLDLSDPALLSQLLVMYANRRLQLQAHGQKAMVYFAPHPPVRQQRLNHCISDSFYRELFMSPCLSGWDKGRLSTPTCTCATRC